MGKQPTTASPVKVAGSWIREHEIPRKFLHGSIALVTIWLYVHGVQLNQVTPVLTQMLVSIGTIEFCRLTWPAVNDLYIKVVGPLMRESEKQGQINGVIWYLVGLIFVFTFFTKDIAVLSVLLLSWADLSASTVGRAFGSKTPKLVGSKSLAGSLAAFACGVAVTWLNYAVLMPRYSQYNDPKDILWTPESSTLSLGTLSVLVGFVAAIAELFPIIDDNLSIPIVSACTISPLIKAFSR